MSDILIKGMEMPKKGEYRMTLYVCDDGYAYMDVDLFPVDKDRFEAVPVPKHGRLIDADALMLEIQEYLDEYDSLDADGYHNPKWCAMREAKIVIESAPTIIPAEEGET